MRREFLWKIRGWLDRASRQNGSIEFALTVPSRKLPGELYQSLTWDRGKELADHKRLALALDVEIYFCDPRSPWQRGSNENTNRLLRQYLPQGTDLSLHSQAKLSAIALSDPGREVRRVCCGDQLNPPWKADVAPTPPAGL